jgi:isocitrate dehydrogenase
MTQITVAKSDGIGPEIMDATLIIIKAAVAKIEIYEIEVGEKVNLSRNTAGFAPESCYIIRKNKIFLKMALVTKGWKEKICRSSN